MPLSVRSCDEVAGLRRRWCLGRERSVQRKLNRKAAGVREDDLGVRALRENRSYKSGPSTPTVLFILSDQCGLGTSY